jgi:hypothetical protein
MGVETSRTLRTLRSELLYPPRLRRTWPFDAINGLSPAESGLGRSFRYPGLAAILSKPFAKNFEASSNGKLPGKARSRLATPMREFTKRALNDCFTTTFIKPLTRPGNSMRSVVITGASAGIGWASAKLLRPLDRMIARRLGLMPHG